MTKEQIADGFSGLQEHICKNLNVLDEIAVFSSDDWQRAGGGGGTTRTIKEGAYIEKGGVAFSKVYGPVTQKMPFGRLAWHAVLINPDMRLETYSD